MVTRPMPVWTGQPRLAHLDVSAGVAGDMLLGALLDAGADLQAVRRTITAVVPGIDVTVCDVSRAGLRALKVQVAVDGLGHPHREWAGIRSTIAAADIPDRVKSDATAVFQRLADAEAAVHGCEAEQVTFHEVGAWDSVADVVGVCAALHALGITTVTCGPLAVGSGTVASAHGRLPVPVPAVVALVRGWEVFGGTEGEAATPTGVALLTTLASAQQRLPRMQVSASGVGAGTSDPPGRANVVRVIVGAPVGQAPADEPMVLLETNVDDADPRVWPSVLEAMLAAGAADAWLSPVLMKKGRPAHTLHVLAPLERRTSLRDVVFRHTSTLGLRELEVCRPALDRTWLPVEVAGERVRIKVASQGGVVLHAAAEYDDVAAAAKRLGRPVREILELANVAAIGTGLLPGAGLPERPASGR
ncbi:MAG: nickel pincer cofactor biosynthesis protein LarC [Dermatophilaceae bacterium]